MDGTVSSFLSAKGYGFARGDDGRDYFLHRSDLDEACGTPMEGQRITFEQTATPKGYRARRVRPLGVVGPVRYLMPEVVVHSRGPDIRGWEVLQSSRWTVHGSSRDSPDEARAALLARVAELGGNGAILVSYYKSTGEEAGTGQGTHRFTIHNFKARPVIVGRASTTGTMAREDLDSLDERAGELKEQLASLTRSAKTGASLLAAVVVGAGVVFAMGMDGIGSLIALGVGVAGGVFAFNAMAEDHDWWLQPPSG